jgi:CheY-like chemotaxis protein
MRFPIEALCRTHRKREISTKHKQRPGREKGGKKFCKSLFFERILWLPESMGRLSPGTRRQGGAGIGERQQALMKQSEVRGVILVVDDEDTIVQFVQDALEDEGYTVCVAFAGTQALRVARQQKPDLVILDIMLPPTGSVRTENAEARYGNRMLRILRSLARGPLVPMPLRL